MKNNLFRSQKPKKKKRVYCRNIIICLKIRKNYSPINITLSVKFSENRASKQPYPPVKQLFLAPPEAQYPSHRSHVGRHPPPHPASTKTVPTTYPSPIILY